MAEQEQQDVDALKRRGRRRLVGAVALVLLAVIVLPMVFDPEPRGTLPPVTVTVPGRDDAGFTPKGPKPPPRPSETKGEATPAPEADAKAPDEKNAIEAVKAEAPKGAAKEAIKERARAEAALANAQFVVPVGAFANPDSVIAKLSAAKVPYYTEAAPGNLTRVRAGPFASREAADKAAARLKGLGLQPGPVASRAG
ncbi:MAG TPA: SPOR domain-containing protein [Burkholderiales bacterium]|nr:SPOR domain-containing protein [Burkholderiales bacterium]